MPSAVVPLMCVSLIDGVLEDLQVGEISGKCIIENCRLILNTCIDICTPTNHSITNSSTSLLNLSAHTSAARNSSKSSSSTSSTSAEFHATRSGMSLHHANFTNWSSSNFVDLSHVCRLSATCLADENSCSQGTDDT